MVGWFTVERVKAGASVSMVLRVPHDCGRTKTTGIDVQFPASISTATNVAVRRGGKPLPSWTVKLQSQGGRTVLLASGKAVAASDAMPLDIRFTITVPRRAGTLLTFPTVQHCGKTTVHWLQAHEAGAEMSEDAYPMPQVLVTT